MQGGRNGGGGGRRPYGGGPSHGGNRNYQRGPYDRGQSRPYREAPSHANRISTVKEAMETNVLLSSSQFLGMSDISLPDQTPEVKERAFEEYKERHRRAALERFFLGHKDEAWFTEHYLGDEMETEAAGIRATYDAFMTDYNEGKMAELKLDFEEDMVPSHEIAEFISMPLSASIPAAIAGAAIQHYTDVLTIGNVPPTVKKASLESLLRDSSDQFENLFLGEPVYEKGLYRSGFAVFSEGTDLNALALKLENVLVDGSKIYYSVQRSFTRQIKLAGGEFSTPEQMEKDLLLVWKLVEAFCSRYDLPPCPWAAETELPRALDLNLALLRRVFLTCYYSGVHSSDPLEFQKTCGDFCLRSPTGPGPSPTTVETKVKDLIRLYGPPFEPATEENIIESKFVIRLDESRYRCSLCSKLFKGPEFVIKHIRLKHEEESATALQQLSLLNLFLAKPASCAFLKTIPPRRSSLTNGSSSGSIGSRSHHRPAETRQPPPDADTRVLRRPMKQYVDWDAPAAGEVEIDYD